MNINIKSIYTTIILSSAFVNGYLTMSQEFDKNEDKEETDYIKSGISSFVAGAFYGGTLGAISPVILMSIPAFGLYNIKRRLF